MSSSSPPVVSVIVLNYNGMRFLRTCFDSLAGCTYPRLELLMVDNGSTDDSIRFVQENYPLVQVLNSGGNIGYSAGNNLGIAAAKGEYVVLLNNDVEVTPGWVEPLVEEFESDPSIAACQPKILHLVDRHKFEYAGAAGGWMDLFGYPFLRGRVFNTTEEDRGQYDDSVDLFWTSGAAMAIRKSALEHTGDLDVDFVHHMEEIDLCWRMHLQGYRLRVRPDAVIYHYAGGTIKPDSYAKIYWNHRNSLLMLLKNLGWPRLSWVLPVRLALDAVLLLKSLLTLDLKRLAAVLAGYFWLAVHPRLIWNKRRVVQAARQVTDRALDPYIYHGSLVLTYYLLGRKTFREIQGQPD